MSPLAHVLRGLLAAYRYSLSPLIGSHCRYQPTCSDYAMQAIARHGGMVGGWMTVRRLLRCHPWGGSGFDPVPGTNDASQAERR